jgi:tricorn protease-like protein
MRSLLCVFFILFITAFISVFAQDVQVINKIEVTSIDNGQYFYPKFNTSGDKIIFTSETYKGLWLYDTNTKVIRNISQREGVGFKPNFNKSDKSIVCRSYMFENNKRISTLLNIDVVNGQESVLLENERDLNYPMQTSLGNVFTLVNKKVMSFEQSLQKQNPLQNELAVYIENSNLILESMEGIEVLNPLGDGNYLWPSFSNDGKKLLFTKAGVGTFVSDLDGNIIAELGRANFAKWAKDDEWIVFMDDYDDGVHFISSEIKARHIASGKTFNLTQTNNEIEMYPEYSASTDEVVYHTTDGRIIKLTLQFN